MDFPTFTYYAGFEKEFKRLTKKYSKIKYFKDNYGKLYEQFKNDDLDSDNDEEEIFESEEDDDDDDVFDEMASNDKKIKKNKIIELKKNHLFYYKISKKYNYNKNYDSNEREYECGIMIFDKEIEDWLYDNENMVLDEINGITYCEIDSFFTFINDFRIKKENNEYKNPKQLLFIEYVEKLFSKDYKKFDKMISNKSIDFNSIWYYFDKIKTYYVVDHNDQKICFLYDSFNYTQTDSGKVLILNGYLSYCNDKGIIYNAPYEFEIKYYDGKKDIDSFNIETLNEDYKKLFLERKNKVIKLSSEIKQMHLKGNQYIVGQKLFIIDRDERVMVDNTQEKYIYNLLGPEFKKSKVNIHKLQNELKINNDYTLYPFVPVFNLGNSKTWGTAFYDSIKEIEYNDDIFSKIVMKEDKKNILNILIKNYDSEESTNLIKNKGKNLIFLLHGPPGVGKTLTAEATSDLLRKPLYNISISDIDLDASKLEICLKEIDKICQKWNAILLIDEAEIFLEARNYSDISRNVIVATFLKFLEYSKNIIFLTTNRLETLDVAVKSRISLIITYPKLSCKERSTIWENLLKDYEFTNKKNLISQLSDNEINGREISNLLDVIKTVFKSKEIPINSVIENDEFLKIFKKCLSINNESEFKIKESSLYC